ncbi:Hypothetical protein GSB_15474, partial [Giardia duodenalis]
VNFITFETMGASAEQKDVPKTAPAKPKERPNKSDKRKNSFKASHAKRLEDAIAWMYHWHTDKSTWTFDKKQQTLLVQAWMDSERMPKDTFAVFCLFAAGSEAEAFKRRLLQEAEIMLTRYRNNKENENLRRQAKRAVKLKAALSSGKNDPEAQLLAGDV